MGKTLAGNCLFSNEYRIYWRLWKDTVVPQMTPWHTLVYWQVLLVFPHILGHSLVGLDLSLRQVISTRYLSFVVQLLDRLGTRQYRWQWVCEDTLYCTLYSRLAAFLYSQSFLCVEAFWKDFFWFCYYWGTAKYMEFKLKCGNKLVYFSFFLVSSFYHPRLHVLYTNQYITVQYCTLLCSTVQYCTDIIESVSI